MVVFVRLASLLVVPLLLVTSSAEAASGTLLDFVKGRSDLSRSERARWHKAVKLRFGGAALNDEAEDRPEIGVAKAILSAAIFMGVKPKKAVDAAWEGWRGALGYVPPPIAIHYEILALQGRKPRGRPIDLAFKFPDYYNEEIAPELVAYWEENLRAGKIPDAALEETKEALAATRVKMRPLLLDKLRLMASLAREVSTANGARRAEIERDLGEIQEELERAFSRVARRPEVLDPRKTPYDRLRIQLEDMGLRPSEEDRLLDPRAPPPPRQAVPEVTEKPVERSDDGTVLVEPDEAPPAVLPPQPRPGDGGKFEDIVPGRTLAELVKAYKQRLERAVTSWLGTPYRWGNGTPKVGTDCSGFVQALFGDTFRIRLPRVSRDQYRTGHSVSKQDLRPGDLVFFDTRDAGRINHVGVYAGKGTFAHASSSRGVVYDKLASRYFARAYRGARRLLAYP